jgi:methylated-DNA-[protein]-cysteine S-methyltransferase
MQTSYQIYKSPVGELYLVASGTHLEYCLFRNGWETRRAAIQALHATNPVLDETINQLEDFFTGRRRAFTLPLKPAGTDFEKTVWTALHTIPFAETRSYSEIAKCVGRTKAARAIGRANALNPICVITPCHRVIGQDGSLTGYAGGIDAKLSLLSLERSHLQNKSLRHVSQCD